MLCLTGIVINEAQLFDFAISLVMPTPLAWMSLILALS